MYSSSFFSHPCALFSLFRAQRRAPSPVYSVACALFVVTTGVWGYDPVENSRVSPANYRLSTMNLGLHLTSPHEALSLMHSPVPNGGCGMPRHLRAVFVALCLVLLVSG